MKKIEISIIMGIYNCEKYLDESIKSIINQTYKAWELIMCDDGSTDNTYDIALKYAEKYPEKIILLKNNKNNGLNYTLNKCLKHAKGEYIARQDGDDISSLDRLEKEINCIKEKKVAMVSCNMEYIDEKGTWGRSKMIENPQNKDFIKGSPFCHAPCLIKKEAMEDIGGYSEDKKLLRVEDYHLWFKLYSKGYKGYNMPNILYKMRDDMNAANRRNIKNKINEIYVRYIGFKMLKINPIYYIYIFRPIVTMLLPKKLYYYMHKRKIGGKK